MYHNSDIWVVTLLEGTSLTSMKTKINFKETVYYNFKYININLLSFICQLAKLDSQTNVVEWFTALKILICCANTV